VIQFVSPKIEGSAMWLVYLMMSLSAIQFASPKIEGSAMWLAYRMIG
jgi:hypothetical protein